LRALLLEKSIGHILATGLHQYLDDVQIHIQALAASIGRAFFRDWRPGDDAPAPEAAAAPAQSQSQSQGGSPPEAVA
jgi:hypothetical protein